MLSSDLHAQIWAKKIQEGHLVSGVGASIWGSSFHPSTLSITQSPRKSDSNSETPIVSPVLVTTDLYLVPALDFKIEHLACYNLEKARDKGQNSFYWENMSDHGMCIR